MYANQLCSAIYEHDIEKLSSLLGQEETDDVGIMLAFSTAVQVGKPKVVSLFIESARVNVDAVDLMFGETALMHAARQGHLELIQYLLRSGANINERSSQSGVTALHVCCSGPEKPSNNAEVLDYLLNHGGIDLEARDTDGYTPLMRASSQTQVEETKRLLVAGCDMNSVLVANGQNPVHLCLQVGYFTKYPLAGVDCFRLFLEHGLCPDFRDGNGVPLIGYAVNSSHVKALYLLLYVNCDIDILYTMSQVTTLSPALCYVVLNKRMAFVKTLIAAGCELFNLRDAVRNFFSQVYHIESDFGFVPRPLKELCRQRIRKVLGYFPHRKMNRTGLPKLLQEYIMLKDVIGEIQFQD